MSPFKSGAAGFIEANLASIWPGSRVVCHLAGQRARRGTRFGAAGRRKISNFSEELAFEEPQETAELR